MAVDRLQCYMLCTSGFVNNVTFLDNRPNRRESNTTHMFHPVRKVAAPGAKSAVPGCILLFRLLRPGRWAKYCEQRVCMYVCLFVCVCPLAHLKNTFQISLTFLYMLCYLWPWLGPPLMTVYCVILPVLWMTSCFHITGLGAHNE